MNDILIQIRYKRSECKYYIW